MKDLQCSIKRSRTKNVPCRWPRQKIPTMPLLLALLIYYLILADQTPLSVDARRSSRVLQYVEIEEESDEEGTVVD